MQNITVTLVIVTSMIDLKTENQYQKLWSEDKIFPPYLFSGYFTIACTQTYTLHVLGVACLVAPNLWEIGWCRSWCSFSHPSMVLCYRPPYCALPSLFKIPILLFSFLLTKIYFVTFPSAKWMNLNICICR